MVVAVGLTKIIPKKEEPRREAGGSLRAQLLGMGQSEEGAGRLP